MCMNLPAEPNPAQVICDLMRKDLNVTIQPEAMALFIKHRWPRLATAAHRIHESDAAWLWP